MLVFDASNRDQCEVNRLRTNTPLQALVLMNDPVVLEAARVFAEKLMKEGNSFEEKIFNAFRAVTCRKPKDEEMQLLVNYYANEKKKFTVSSEDAKKFVQAGEYPKAEIDDVSSLAALMQVIHTIYNLEESITKG
jgi:hypothetical protein